MKAKILGQKREYYKVIDSTNLKAKEKAEKGAVHGSLFVADKQTKGRGRRGRTWDSPPNSNLYFSLLLRPLFNPEKASMLTILMAVSVEKAFEELGVEKIQIKWPNDLILNGKKICGILTEMSTKIDSIEYVVIGVGINLGNYQFPEELQKMATTVYQETGKLLDRELLLEKILFHFETVYEEFSKVQNLCHIKKDYEAHLVNRNKEVRILDPKEEFCAIAKGITETGELVVINQNQEEKLIYAGEVSVRGVYGYV